MTLYKDDIILTHEIDTMLTREEDEARNDEETSRDHEDLKIKRKIITRRTR